MDLEKLNKKLQKDRERYIIKKYDMKEKSTLLMGLNINKLYSVDKNIIDMSLVVHIQEESHASLFTQPTIYVKYQAEKIHWLRKDFYGFDYAYNDLNLDNILVDLDPDGVGYIKMPDETQKYCLYLVNILDNYEWDHFVNIGSFERTENTTPEIWHSLEIKNKTERIWIGNLSEQNWLETLSLITSYPRDEFKEQMTHLLSQYNKENLEVNLSNNNSNKTKTKVKI